MDQQAAYRESGNLPLDANIEQQVHHIQSATWKDYLQLTKPGITLSNLLSTFTGFWLASATFGFGLQVDVLIFTLLGTAFFIASAATLNNYLDRELDMKMKRTKNRGIAAGRIHPRNALAMGIALLIAGIVVLAVYANPLAAVFGLIGHIFYVLIYTPLKRVTTLNTVIGGVAGAAPPVIGWVAVTNNLDMGAWVLFVILFLWQPPHFLALAMLKAEDYRAAGIPMLPVVRGFEETKRQMLYYTMALLPASISLMLYANLNLIYLVAMLALGVVYVVILAKGFRAKDDLKWAKKLFGFSLIYLTVFCFAVIISSM